MDINPIRLMDLAKVASREFLSNGKTLNEVIAKIAEEHELTPMQIRRVSEHANHEANLALYKRSEDKTFAFELADPDQIINMIQAEVPKTAGVDVFDVIDATRAMGLEKRAEGDPEIFGLTIEEDPTLGECQQRNINILLEKLAYKTKAFKRETMQKLAGIRAEISGIMDQIGEMARDHIFDNKGNLSDLLKFACVHDPDYSNVFKVAFEHIRDSLVEKLGAPVDAALLADNLEIPDSTLEVINGEHSLAIILDTFKNKISDEDRETQHQILLGTFGNAVVDQMNVLKTPEDVDKNLEETLVGMDKKSEEGREAFLEMLGQSKEALGPMGKALLMLGGGLGLKGVYDITKETTKGAVKGAARERNERKRLEELAVRRGLY